MLGSAGLSGHSWESGRPDAHAPISIMGDHTHKEGEWMFSYRYGYMNMDGMREGTSGRSSADVFSANYTVTPAEMDMRMHMFGLMYAPSDRLTLMLMTSQKELSMKHEIFPMAAPLIALNGGEQTFETEASGWGDSKLTGLFQLWKSDSSRLHAGFGLSLPSGSIEEQDVTPGPGGRINRLLPASMQLGSGTVDIIPSLTYFSQADRFSYGAQVSGEIRLGRNDRGYSLGDKLMSNVWMGYLVNDLLSTSLQVRYSRLGSLDGDQEGIALNPPFAPSRRTIPTAFAENYGREQLEVGLGCNLVLPVNKKFGTHRIALEVLLPVWQDVNGLQLENDYGLLLGYQLSF